MDSITKRIGDQQIEFFRSHDPDAPGWITTIGDTMFRIAHVHRRGWYAYLYEPPSKDPVAAAGTMSKVFLKLLEQQR